MRQINPMAKRLQEVVVPLRLAQQRGKSFLEKPRAGIAGQPVQNPPFAVFRSPFASSTISAFSAIRYLASRFHFSMSH